MAELGVSLSVVQQWQGCHVVKAGTAMEVLCATMWHVRHRVRESMIIAIAERGCPQKRYH